MPQPGASTYIPTAPPTSVELGCCCTRCRDSTCHPSPSHRPQHGDTQHSSHRSKTAVSSWNIIQTLIWKFKEGQKEFLLNIYRHADGIGATEEEMTRNRGNACALLLIQG
ncbi:hypothetical protein ATANTOWER_011390 [Ataeniobius toweri]|uniref:Uncharacterized protein n=1 Tax=Ataeniobius toweri TaxID=208326 RepID=A0ABU7A6Z5_9TELE|nr:hypothetical protein [Ataeniobius toweri]